MPSDPFGWKSTSSTSNEFSRRPTVWVITSPTDTCGSDAHGRLTRPSPASTRALKTTPSMVTRSGHAVLASMGSALQRKPWCHGTGRRICDNRAAPPSNWPPAMKKPKSAAPAVTSLHPRNRHTGRYDFAELSRQLPLLAAYVGDNGHGEDSIDFSDPHAVRALNRALLKSQYGIANWDIPAGFLVPPIPGRADYVHGVADLLASSNGGEIPTGPGVRVLDVGTGANIIYPLIGNREYGWRFTASEVDTAALRAGKAIVDANPGLGDAIFLRRQEQPEHIFEQLLKPEDRFDISMCNPPFHASAKEAAAGNLRKTRNLDTT